MGLSSLAASEGSFWGASASVSGSLSGGPEEPRTASAPPELSAFAELVL